MLAPFIGRTGSELAGTAVAPDLVGSIGPGRLPDENEPFPRKAEWKQMLGTALTFYYPDEEEDTGWLNGGEGTSTATHT